jgi:LysM repeat protein
MRTFKILTLLILGLAVFGPAAYFGYALFVKPSRVERADRQSRPAATPTPTPDTGEAELKKIASSGNDPAVTREALTAWISSHPSSPLLGDAKRSLGTLNMSLLFQPGTPSAGTNYTVVKGDSLARIASRFHSNPELLQKANSLPGTALSIGQVLIVPSLDISLILDRGTKTLTLLDKGSPLREYPLLSAPPAPKTPSETKSKVLDKIATFGGKRIAFGDKSYGAAERLILVAQAPSITSWTPPAPVEPSSATNAPTAPQPSPAQMPGGYVLTPADLAEIFPLVSRNTPVTIH